MVPEDVPLPVLRDQLESVASDGGRFSFWDGDSSFRHLYTKRWLDQARFDLRGYTTSGSVRTLTRVGRPDSKARSSTGRSSLGSRTRTPSQPSDSTSWS